MSEKGLGTYNVRQKKHSRKYNLSVPEWKGAIYSAKLPNTKTRRRLKREFESIYRLALEGGDVLIDVNSGNEIENVTLTLKVDMDCYMFEDISEADFLKALSDNQLHAVAKNNKQTLLFTDTAASQGIGVQHTRNAYVRFSLSDESE